MTVPADFPRSPSIASVSGAQAKFAVRLDAVSGKYTDEPTEAEVQARYNMCLDLAEQLVAKCLANRETKYYKLSDVQILKRLLVHLTSTRWGTKAEMQWVVRKTASGLGWAVPESSLVFGALLGEKL
ncbi:hypothetical protein [Duganella sp. S19_KUP01_CR8]|uniref:hypothetical protein n=1 Tax=Duganella sp. S19_KUP01_CR8 TaxID=3025502 RepID=UPI002FCDDDFE